MNLSIMQKNGLMNVDVVGILRSRFPLSLFFEKHLRLVGLSDGDTLNLVSFSLKIISKYLLELFCPSVKWDSWGS